MNFTKYLRNHTLDTIGAMLDDGIIKGQDLRRFIGEEVDVCEPEYLRWKMEMWYRTLGIEYLSKGKFALQLPYFTKEEIKDAYDNNEVIVCVPKGIGVEVLGRLFNFSSWAFVDPLVNSNPEVEDFWFKTSCSIKPEYLDREGREIKSMYQRDGKLNMNLGRYLTFLAYMRYKGTILDQLHKVWLPNSRYEKKGMLIAGLDSNGMLAVHGWMPNFHSPLVGGRFVEIPDHI